jgi:hypothetical protein
MHRCEERTVQHSNGWLTLYYRLPSHLPDFAHLTLRSIEVAAVTPVKPDAAIISADNCLGYVGESNHTQAHLLQASHYETLVRMMPECLIVRFMAASQHNYGVCAALLASLHAHWLIATGCVIIGSCESF